MNKMKLVPDALRVDSFEPADAAEMGTVQAYAEAGSTGSYLRPCFHTEQRTCTC